MTVNIPLVTADRSVLYNVSLNKEGDIINAYAPFHNLLTENGLDEFTTTGDKLNFDLEHPVDVVIQEAYDGAVNVVLNDNKSPIKLINSRFSIQDKKFTIPDHSGYKDSNIYNSDTFNVDTSLITHCSNIVDVKFNGLLLNSGSVPCGTYTFYFKLSDADYNESEVIAESGMVYCFIGDLNTPNTIRMGMEDENTLKAISFTLSNIPAGFEYLHVYYSRVSSAYDQLPVTSFYRVNRHYNIYDGKCDLIFTFSEDIKQVTEHDIFTDFADISKAISIDTSNNALLIGNTSIAIRNYEALKTASWGIIPKWNKRRISKITNKYQNTEEDNISYYDSLNLYNNVGYFPGDIYKIGIVYLFEDGGLSPVFNLLGIDFSAFEPSKFKEEWLFANIETKLMWSSEPEDCWFRKSINNLNVKLNSRGVFKMPLISLYRNNSFGILCPEILYLTFTLPKHVISILKQEKVKGYFFVRLKRYPTIIALGLAIGKTSKECGNLPVIKNSEGFCSQSFLTKYNDSIYKAYTDSSYTEEIEWVKNKYNKSIYLKNSEGQTRNSSDASLEGFLIKYDGSIYKLSKDAIGEEEGSIDDYFIHKLSLLFTKNESSDVLIVSPEGNDINTTEASCHALLVPDAEMHEAVYNNYFTSQEYALLPVYDLAFDYDDVKSHAKFKRIKIIDSSEYITTKLTNVPEGIKIITDGDQYYSTLAGSAAEAYLTLDVAKPWDMTKPQDLTTSNTLVRGNWGAYVGSSSELTYGRIYNIRKLNYAVDEELATIQDFELVFKRYSEYHAITLLKELNVISLSIYRGDCFVSLFTHRMLRNFVDNELQTNHKIVDPLTWSKNYRVRCTALILDKTHSNVMHDNEGWSVSQEGPYANEVVDTFEIKKNTDFKSYANQLRVAKLSESESNAGINFKALFRNDVNWEMRSRGNINRGDINAVGLGQWITFPICSNTNYSFRDVDFLNPEELTVHGYKRSFYPLKALDKHNHLRDSNCINAAASVTLPSRNYFEILKVPFIKQEYLTRIYNSAVQASGSFVNNWKKVMENSYNDLEKKYGSITKIVAVGGLIVVVFKHGIMQYSINSQALKLSQLFMPGQLISADLGSQWKDSILYVPGGIIGVDTVAKKIWMCDGQTVYPISDTVIQRFLIDNIDFSEFDTQVFIGHKNVKTHFNSSKNDVIITYCNDKLIDNKWHKGKRWAIAYNIQLKKWITFYDWYPLMSENIDNIFFSFDQDAANELLDDANYMTYNQYLPSTELDSIKINKKQIDPAFSNKTNIYQLKNNRFEKFIFNVGKLNKQDKLCISFYVHSRSNQSIFDLKIDANNIVNNKIDKDWRFCTLWINVEDYYAMSFALNQLEYYPGNITVLINSDVDIAELKLTILNEDLISSYYTILNKIDDSGLYWLCSENVGCSLDLNKDVALRNLLYSIRNSENYLPLWKHGQAGLYDNQEDIKPTNWYGKLHKWYFEFIVNEAVFELKIFTNLKMLSNKTAPYAFEYELIGEGYNWHVIKPIIYWTEMYSLYNNIPRETLYQEILTTDYSVLKLKYLDYPNLNLPNNYKPERIPNITIEFEDENRKTLLSELSPIIDNEYSLNTGITKLTYDKRLNDYKIKVNVLGNDMRHTGRVRGNMMYLEDFWNIELRPIAYKYWYIDNDELKLSEEYLETRPRDKWIKIKIIYTGEDLSIILAVATVFNESQA